MKNYDELYELYQVGQLDRCLTATSYRRALISFAANWEGSKCTHSIIRRPLLSAAPAAETAVSERLLHMPCVAKRNMESSSRHRAKEIKVVESINDLVQV